MFVQTRIVIDLEVRRSFDTCPSREHSERFAAGEAFAPLRERHGLPDPISIEDFSVHCSVGGRTNAGLTAKAAMGVSAPG